MRSGIPSSASGDHGLCGVYYAVVTQNKDEENRCRVKIRLPWLDQGDTDQTQWASIAAPMAGNEFGWYTIPDVDDVVAVMFIAGDISRPVVLGGVWSKTDAPPETNAGDNDFRGYKSRAGARMVMDDSSNGKVYMADKTDNNAVVVGSFQQGGSGGNARAAAVPPAITGSPQGGISIASSDGDVEITAKGKLKVTATNIEITSKSNVDLKADGNANFEGALVNASGSAGAKVDGSQTKIN